MKPHSFTFNSKLKNVLRSIVFILFLVLAIHKTTYLLSAKNSWIIKEDFYDAEVNFDVLLMGTSHMYDGIYPMELYRDYGISSYNLAVAGERFAMTYWSLKDALQYTQPKLVVIDVHALEYGDQKNDPNVPQRVHESFDAMRMGKIKIQAVMDVIEKDAWSEFFFPLELYHNRWTELTENDFKDPKDVNATHNGFFQMGVANKTAPKLLAPDDFVIDDNYSVEYLRKIIELCQSKDIEVLLVCIPYPAPEESQRCINQAYAIAAEYNIEYMNMLYLAEEIGVDYITDAADAASHLNPSGARKVTKYIGQYIIDNYEVWDYRLSEESTEWNQYYNEYLQYKDEKLQLENNLYYYLMLLADFDYSYCAYIANQEILQDELSRNLYKNTMPLVQIDKWEAENQGYFISNISGSVVEVFGLGEITSMATNSAYEFAKDETGVRIQVSGQEGINEEADISIAVINNHTGELIDWSNWKYNKGRVGRITE